MSCLSLPSEAAKELENKCRTLFCESKAWKERKNKKKKDDEVKKENPPNS